MSRRLLVTGMSGTGKSSVIDELTARDRHAVDLDSPDWSEYALVDGQQEWIWQRDRVHALLGQKHPGVLYVSGCASNQGEFRFDHIVLLIASVELTTERLRTRTTNRYGQRPGELEEVLANKREIEPLLRQVADLWIDTELPLPTVVDTILDHAADPDPCRPPQTSNTKPLRGSVGIRDNE